MNEKGAEREQTGIDEGRPPILVRNLHSKRIDGHLFGGPQWHRCLGVSYKVRNVCPPSFECLLSLRQKLMALIDSCNA